MILQVYSNMKMLFCLLNLSIGIKLNQKITKFEKTDQNTFLKTVLITKENGLEVNVMDVEFKNGIQDKFMRVNGKMIKLKDTVE